MGSSVGSSHGGLSRPPCSVESRPPFPSFVAQCQFCFPSQEIVWMEK